MPVTFADRRVRNHRQADVRKDVCNNSRYVGSDRMNAEEQKAERSEDHDEPRHSKEKVKHRVEIIQSLPDREAFLDQRTVRSKYLRHSSRPSYALLYVRSVRFRCETRRQ